MQQVRSAWGPDSGQITYVTSEALNQFGRTSQPFASPSFSHYSLPSTPGSALPGANRSPRIGSNLDLKHSVVSPLNKTPRSYHLRRSPHTPTEEKIKVGFRVQNGPIPGMYVVQVIPGSPADRCDLKVGDIIHVIGGHKTNKVEDFPAIALKFRAGDAIPIKLTREDQPYNVILRLPEVRARETSPSPQKKQAEEVRKELAKLKAEKKRLEDEKLEKIRREKKRVEEEKKRKEDKLKEELEKRKEEAKERRALMKKRQEQLKEQEINERLALKQRVEIIKKKSESQLTAVEKQKEEELAKKKEEDKKRKEELRVLEEQQRMEMLRQKEQQRKVREEEKKKLDDLKKQEMLKKKKLAEQVKADVEEDRLKREAIAKEKERERQHFHLELRATFYTIFQESHN